MEFTLSQNMWFGNQPVKINLPDYWNVSYHTVPVDDLLPLTAEQIWEKITKPHGMKPLRELACGRKKSGLRLMISPEPLQPKR